jgi:hypothetical protein
MKEKERVPGTLAFVDPTVAEALRKGDLEPLIDDYVQSVSNEDFHKYSAPVRDQIILQALTLKVLLDMRESLKQLASKQKQETQH